MCSAVPANTLLAEWIIVLMSRCIGIPNKVSAECILSCLFCLFIESVEKLLEDTEDVRYTLIKKVAYCTFLF